MKRLVLTYGFILSALLAKAQDPQFTQFYANPLYLNPAFAGTTVQSRAVMASRVQWPSIPGAFQTYSVSYDQFFPMIKSGFGLAVYYDRAGSAGLSRQRGPVPVCCPRPFAALPCAVFRRLLHQRPLHRQSAACHRH